MSLPFYTCLCAIAKDEEVDDLKEWIYYHLGIGFEYIIIYDNNSREPLTNSLAKLIATGLVEVIPFPLDKAPQLSAYFHCLRLAKGQCRWLAFLDIDEFLVPTYFQNYPNPIRQLLYHYEDFAGISFSWLMFSSSGHLKRPTNATIRNYFESLGTGYHFKSIVDPSKVIRPLSPHHFAFVENAFCINEYGLPLKDSYYWSSMTTCRVHHYYYKSQQDYEAKIKRGLACAVANSQGRTLDRFYQHLHETTKIDTSILPFAKVAEDLAKLNTQALRAKVLDEANLTLDSGLQLVMELIDQDLPDYALRLIKRLDATQLIPANLLESLHKMSQAIFSQKAPWLIAKQPEIIAIQKIWHKSSLNEQYQLLERVGYYFENLGLIAQANAIRDFLATYPS